jgi:hypothetical protein
MKRNNIIRTCLTLTVAGFVVGCTPDLDIDNPSEIPTDKYYTSASSLEKTVNSAYEAMVGQYGAWNSGGSGRYLPFNLLLPGDDYTNTFKWPDLVYNDTYSVPSSSQYTKNTWRSFFAGVRAANTAIFEIENFQGTIDESTKNRLLGEAYFLRGYFYIWLDAMFGETIPLYDHPVQTNDDYYPANAAPGAIYAQTVSDFQKAAELLPVRSSMYANSANIGRATKGAAQGFLARTYLWRPILEKGQKSEYAKALPVLREVIESGEYELMSSFRDNFLNTTASENCKESVFEVQMENDANASYSFSWRWKEIGLPDGTGGAWWNVAPNKIAYDEFEDGDPRRYMTLWCPNGAKFYDTEQGDSIDFQEMLDNLSSDKDLYGTRKECIESTFNDVMDDYNDRIMRYSDILLMYAECLHFTGSDGTDVTDQTGAKYWIQQVRDRANNIVPDEQPHLWYQHSPGLLPNVDDLLAAAPTINGRTISDLTTELVHERAVEFMGEYCRYFDLERFGLSVDSKFLEPLQENGWTEAKMYYPIPQVDIDNSPNLEGNSAN